MSKRQSVKQSKRTRRTFSGEFKIRAVKMVTEQGYKIAEAARQLDINPNLLSLCICTLQVDCLQTRDIRKIVWSINIIIPGLI